MALADADHVQFSVRDGAAALRLNRPEKRNAVSREMWLTIMANLRDAAADPRVRALVIEGACPACSAREPT
jgi:enoyl-CoA hydratase/carnithine racemase